MGDKYQTIPGSGPESVNTPGLGLVTACSRWWWLCDICLGSCLEAWRQCCVPEVEEEEPLTSEESRETFTKAEKFASQGRADTQPFLSSISRVNPVPNITDAKWNPPDCDGKTGAIPKRGSIISISGHRIQPSRQPRKNGLNEGEGGRTNTESDKNDGSEFSSKSGTPSPMVSRVPARTAGSSSDLLRDYRETSVASSRGSSDITEPDADNTGLVGVPGGVPHPLTKAGSVSSLGSRSESMASVYSQGEGRYGTVSVKGDLEFGFIYNMVSGSLDINIKQCKELAPVDTKRNRSDPYVKVYLLPDRSKAGKRKTKVKKHTLNPVFEEILKFVMPRNEVERRTMWISVWHSDMFGRNDFLGEVMMPMAGQVFDDPSAKWFSLQDRAEPPEDECLMNSKGDIILALKYVPSETSRQFSKKRKGTLMVKITEAKNLPVPRGSTLPDPYCKSYLLPSHQRGKQKTGVCRKTTSPRWDQTLTWEDLSIEDLADRSLELGVWDHDRLGHQDFLGGVRLNLGSGKHSGRSSSWMDAVGKEVTLWQQMLDRPNFWVEASVSLRQHLESNTRMEK